MQESTVGGTPQEQALYLATEAKRLDKLVDGKIAGHHIFVFPWDSAEDVLRDYEKKVLQAAKETKPFGNTWNPVPLPVTVNIASVELGIHGISQPAVGLSAMQMRNLQVGRDSAVVVVWKQKKTVAVIWNVYGKEATQSPDEIRITMKLAEILGCDEGDAIEIVDVIHPKK